MLSVEFLNKLIKELMILDQRIYKFSISDFSVLSFGLSLQKIRCHTSDPQKGRLDLICLKSQKKN